MKSKSLSPEQEKAAFFPQTLILPDEAGKRHLVIEAGAGAGKTTLLTRRVHWLLCASQQKWRLSAAQLVLVTFSKAADEELRSRVESTILNAGLADEEAQNILSRLHISTIDSLFMQIAGNLFPSWWEQTKNNLDSNTLTQWMLTEQRFPPAMTLVSEAEIIPEVSEEIVKIVEKHAMNQEKEIEILDFVLSGAFQTSASFSPAKAIHPRHQGLERIASTMLHENMIRSDAPPLRFALEKLHPSSLPLIDLLQAKARELFYRRLMHGRLTHNDRMLFLHHLLCMSEKQRENGFFGLAQVQKVSLNCRELIVDEYQDTNQLQHDILSSLIDSRDGRMVVVGDPKQSIYGFRSAHVGVFQRLKTDPAWKLIELTQNFRSHPELLPFINLLSDLTFAYRNNRIPEEFHNTTFAMTARQTYVGAKSLDAGRNESVALGEMESSQKTRVMLLGASLNRQRAADTSLLDDADPNRFAAWALARELKQISQSENGYVWSQMVVLCETNSQVLETQQNLSDFGIPCVAKLSKAVNSNQDSEKRSEDIGLLLAKWLSQPISGLEFSQFLWSGWLQLSREETSALLQACRDGKIGNQWVSDGEQRLNEANPEVRPEHETSPMLPEVWLAWMKHLSECRSLARRHFFAAWQVLRWGFGEHPQNLEMENAALALHQALEIWSIRQSIQNSGLWPGEFLMSQLQQLRLAQSRSHPERDEVSVCTIHGAKGLEWPVVVFWPHAARERQAQNFVLKSNEESTFLKWLAEDKESASLVSWIDNPNPPVDRVAIALETSRGEQLVRWSTDLQDKLEQDFERQRVFYTAFTRAREMLILMSPALQGRARSNMRDKLFRLCKGDAFEPAELNINGLEYTVLATFADMAFDLRKEKKRGAVPPPPWRGLEIEATPKTQDWQGLVRMQDYSPDWLAADPDICSPVKKTHQDDAELQSAEYTPIETMLAEHQNKATKTPWRAEVVTQEIDEAVVRVAQAPVLHPDTDPVLSSAEQGMRFHALMEHSDPTSIKGGGFLQRMLSSATVREHELEIWSASDEEEDKLQFRRGLVATRRKIIDLFCVLEARKFPENLWKSPCILKNSKEISTLRQQLENHVAAFPQLHLVIDFKTGAPSEEHIDQMAEYLAWIREILNTQPAQIVNDIHPTTLFTDLVRPLVGIIYYTSLPPTDNLHNFASALISVDKNASVLFVSPE
ncbi:MAG: UvrD-helicase domain-containing protein [Silvanigrellaceae bacterium]